MSDRLHGSTSLVPTEELFTGTDHSKWPKFINIVYLDLHINKIETNADGKVSVEINMRDYRTAKKEPQIKLGEVLTEDDILDGLTHLDYRLNPVKLKEYRHDKKAAESDRKHAFARLQGRIQEGSHADLTIRKFYPTHDFDGAVAALKQANRAETLAVLLSFTFAMVKLERSSPGQSTPLQINGEVLKLRDDFMSVVKAVVKSDEDTGRQFRVRKIRGEELFNFCKRYATIQTLSPDCDVVHKFVNSKIRENTDPLETVNLKAIDALFEANMNAAASGKPKEAQINNTFIDEINKYKNSLKPEDLMNKGEKRQYALFLASQGRYSNNSADDPEKKKPKTPEFEIPTCQWCQKKGHRIENCFHNPERKNTHVPTPRNFITMPKSVMINMMDFKNIETYSSASSAPELSTFGDPY